MSLALPHSDRVGNDATQAPRGVSSLDLRRRDGSAGDAALSMEARNALIVRRVMAGEVRKSVSAAFGLSEARISQICSAALPVEDRVEVREQAARERLMRRADEALELYECGFTIKEICSRLRRGGPSVCLELNSRPDYTARRPTLLNWRKCDAPEWAPSEHRDRWKQLASGNGRAIASACIRDMLAWEAR